MDAATLEVLAARVANRLLEDEAAPPAETVSEMLESAYDRVAMRLAPYSVPDAALTIVVEVAVRLIRLRGFEGSKSESMGEGGSVSNSFVDDVIDAYSADLKSLKASLAATTGRSGIKFL